MMFLGNPISPRAVCNSVRHLAPDMVARPWNRFEPHSTEWWLVPSSDWPAYKYGKLFFSWGRVDRPSVFAGLYIEKGLAQSVRDAYHSPKGSRFIMDETWSWHLLLHDLANHRIPDIVEGRSSALGEPLEIVVEAGYVQEPSEFDPYAPGFERDLCEFRWTPNGEALAVVESVVTQELLTPLRGVSTWQGLLNGLEQLGTDQWLWVDFFVGLILQQTTKKTDLDLSRCASELWTNWLSYLKPWLVAAG